MQGTFSGYTRGVALHVIGKVGGEKWLKAGKEERRAGRFYYLINI
jgi:hypothetical protein